MSSRDVAVSVVQKFDRYKMKHKEKWWLSLFVNVGKPEDRKIGHLISSFIEY